jgi:hypothetical protein
VKNHIQDFPLVTLQFGLPQDQTSDCFVIKVEKCNQRCILTSSENSLLAERRAK